MTGEILKTDILLCELSEDLSVLKHTWLKAPKKGEFQKELLAVLEVYKKLKASFPGLKWLADTQQLGELSEEDEEWLVTEWDRLLFHDAGVKVHAVILGEDFYADYPMEKFKQSSEKKFNESGAKLEVFLNEKDAMEWLMKN